MTADNRTSQADTYSGNRPEGGPDLSAMTFFSERRSLFFIALLYFSDSLLIFSGRWITDSAGWLSVIVSGLIAAPRRAAVRPADLQPGRQPAVSHPVKDCRSRSHRRFSLAFCRFPSPMCQHGSGALADSGFYLSHRSLCRLQGFRNHQEKRLSARRNRCRLSCGLCSAPLEPDRFFPIYVTSFTEKNPFYFNASFSHPCSP